MHDDSTENAQLHIGSGGCSKRDLVGSIVGFVYALILTVSGVGWLIWQALRIVGIVSVDPNVF